MEFDAQTNHQANDKAAFISWLGSETVSGLLKSAGNAEALRGPVFLYLHRAYEAHLDADLIGELLAGKRDSILNRAGLSKEDEAAVMDAYEVLDPIIEAVYAKM